MDQKRQPIGEHLLLQYLQGKADQTLSAEIERWLSADAGNRALLDRLESLWVEAGKLSPAPVAVDVDAAWKKISAGIDQPESGNREFPAGLSRQIRIRRLWYAAASILILAGALTLLRVLMTGKPVTITAGTNPVTDTLPDGSRVRLNLHSSLTFPQKFDPDSRRVILTGEAFFHAFRNPVSPFLVETDSGSVMVLGTSFLVSAIPGCDLHVAVREGKVRLFTVSPGDRDTLSVILEHGEEGKVVRGVPQKISRQGDSPDAMFWAGELLDFRNTPLQDVIAALERHYPVQIIPLNKSMLNCRLTATFEGESIDNIIMVVAESFGFRYTKSSSTYSLEGAGCPEYESPDR
jgi:ferric-dicitrate binding protein FerR (iron transport regulator)